jgi:hypothetical protein
MKRQARAGIEDSGPQKASKRCWSSLTLQVSKRENDRRQHAPGCEVEAICSRRTSWSGKPDVDVSDEYLSLYGSHVGPGQSVVLLLILANGLNFLNRGLFFILATVVVPCLKIDKTIHRERSGWARDVLHEKTIESIKP